MEDKEFNKIDSDGDGLSDYEEMYIYGTDPYVADTDGDGMNDGDEVKAGRNPAGPGMLHDLFIPHAGNNYHPHVLKPRRIALYAISVILVKVVVVGSALLLPMSAWLSPDIAVEESRKIIKLTNDVRNEENVPVLSENPILSRAAFRKAEDMLIQQYFAHTGPNDRSLANWLSDTDYEYKVAGENLAMGFANAEDVLSAWKKSKTHFANLIDPEFTEIGVAISSGLYQNFDTTFVAQFFGLPKLQKARIIEQLGFLPKVPEKVSTSTEAENSKPSVNSEKEVLQVKVETAVTVLPPEILDYPTITKPINGFETKENIINLLISAPNSKSVKVLVNGKEAGFDEVVDGQAEITIFLEEGDSDIQIVAIKDELSAVSGIYNITVDQSAPTVDFAKTKIDLREAPGQDAKAITASVALSPDTEQAYINYDNYKIELAPQTSTTGVWAGSTLIYSDIDTNAFKPTTLPTITVRDSLGNEKTEDLGWSVVSPTSASLADQYLYQKNNPSNYMKPLFGFSDIYYKILLALAIIFLLINILVRIRRQHPHIILSTIGFMALTVILIVI